MGSGDLVQATCKGALVVETKHGIRHRGNAIGARLDENLLNVGQMMEHGYYNCLEVIKL